VMRQAAKERWKRKQSEKNWVEVLDRWSGGLGVVGV
jgi:hypothetical protein